MRGWASRHRRRIVLAEVMAAAVLFAASGPSVTALTDTFPVYLSQNAVTTDFDGLDDQMGGFAIQPDGKIVAAGATTGADGVQRFAVVRYLPSGILDASFGDGGRVITQIGIQAVANAVALQSDGRIVAAGHAIDRDATVSNGLRHAMVRYLPDGRLDPEFHHPGPSPEFADGGRPGMIRAIAVQPDDKIVVTGDDIGRSAVVGRYLPDGGLDRSFGTGWQLTGAALARSVLVQPDGRIVTAGAEDQHLGTAIITRFLPNGAPDTPFLPSKLTSLAEPEALALQPDGALVVGGENHCHNLGYCFALVRYHPDGTLDTGFGHDGLATTPIGTQAFIRAVILQPDGKILAIGAGTPDRDLDFAVARYRSDGTPDSTFGIDGLVMTQISAQADLPVGAVMSGTRLIVGGDAGFGGPTPSVRGSDFALVGTLLPGVPPPIVTNPPPPSGLLPPPGYWALGADGHVYPFGAARALGNGDGGAVDLEPNPAGTGYWTLHKDGKVLGSGDAPALGNVAKSKLATGEEPTSLSPTPTGKGYWAFTNRGRAIAFGDARFLGDMSAMKLNGPVLGSVATPTGRGYYMVASDGGIFAFGDAAFAGSMGGKKLNAPVQSLVPDSDGKGYWLVASDGGIFAFDAPFRGSMGGTKLNKPVVGMVRYGDGYLMVGADGGIFNFSTAPFAGSLGDKPPTAPVVAVAALP